MLENNDQKILEFEQKNPLLMIDPDVHVNSDFIQNIQQSIQKIDVIDLGRQSFSEKITGRLSNLSQTLKMEESGILYCLLAQFLWTTNSVYLKFLIQYFKGLFKNKSFLFARGLMATFLGYFLGKYEVGKIYSLSELPSDIRKLIILRGNANYFSMAFFVVAVIFLRISTCQILNCLAPIVVIFFSVIFLGEKFYIRYIFGIILGILGSSIIILNEKKSTNGTTETKNSGSSEIIIGIFCIFISITFSAIENISNKKLTNNKVPISTQLFYVGATHSVYSFLWMLFTVDFDYTLKYFIMSFFHAVFFFMGNFFFNKGLQRIDLSKSSLIQYSKIVFVFVLSVVLLGQGIFMTDIFGSVIIVSFMVYHIMNPIR